MDELPDYASVNLSEPDAPAVMELLRHRGIAIEAGLASIADVERFVKLPDHSGVLRILIEIEEQDLGVAREVVDEMTAVLDRASLRRPILLHGFDMTFGHLSNLLISGDGRRVLGWRTASISWMERRHPRTPRWLPPRLRYSVQRPTVLPLLDNKSTASHSFRTVRPRGRND